MFLGIGTAIITPPLGTPLSGYQTKRPAQSVLDDLEIRVFWFQLSPDDENPICIVCADIIGFDDESTASIRRALLPLGIAPAAVLLAASHTHSGAATCKNLESFGGLPQPEYSAFLQARIVEAASAARSDLRAIEMRVGRGVLEGFSINRRRVENGMAQFAPNPDGVRDDEVFVLACRDAQSGELRAALFHFSCHPTILGTTEISGDYPGAARRFLESKFPHARAGFLPGCFGEIRPNGVFVGGAHFRSGTPRDIEIFGDALGEEVARIINGSTPGGSTPGGSTLSPPLAPRAFARIHEIELPLQNGEHRALSVQRIDLAEELSLLAMGAEIGVDYGRFIKSLSDEKTLLPLGYSNGCLGYVCPAYQFPEGGYEPCDSAEGYGLPAPFSSAIEEIIQREIRALLENETSSP